MTDTDPLKQADDASARRAWSEAHQAYESAEESGVLDPPHLERSAVAAYMAGDPEAHFDRLERAHDAHLAAGEHRGAARCAMWIGLHRLSRRESDIANGWLSRAEGLLERVGGECPEHGYLHVPVALRHLSDGAYEESASSAQQAFDIGQRHDDADLSALALHLRGRALLRQGRLTEGMPMLEEAMVPVTWDGLSPIIAGTIYRSALEACREVHAHRQADAWSDSLVRWCGRQPEMVAFMGECLVFRAEALQARGDWEAADRDVRTAVREYAFIMDRRTVGRGYYRLGELYRLRGHTEDAEEAYREASLRGWDPQPGLARLRLEQGRAEAGVASLRRALSEQDDPLVRARLLPAFLELLIVTGDLDEARGAAEALAEVVERYDSEALRATYDQARGALALAEGRPHEALDALSLALSAWQDLELPYEEARTRVLLGRAHGTIFDQGTAGMELWTARAAFASLGAFTDVDRVDALGA